MKKYLIRKLFTKEYDTLVSIIQQKNNEIDNLKARLKMVQWEANKAKFILEQEKKYK